jgi:glycosyltransferase involved in cell wall biosynthesis
MKADISVIILTLNEQLHIERCIESILQFTDNIYIVDCNSVDDTLFLAESLGAKVFYNNWPGSHALQFQWGLDNCPINTEWVMKVDADEYILPELAEEITEKLGQISNNTNGIYIKRRVLFMDKWIKHGGYYPIWLLRIWRYGCGSMEQRLMDEHIVLSHGNTLRFHHDLVDDNKSGLTSWTDKHNHYASKEVVDVLNKKFNFFNENIDKGAIFKSSIERKKWLRYRYDTLPLFVRPVLYFIYRYFILLGFLDGKPGLILHFLQGFWYRMYIDAKIYEVYKYTNFDKVSVLRFIKDKYKIDIKREK